MHRFSYYLLAQPYWWQVLERRVVVRRGETYMVVAGDLLPLSSGFMLYLITRLPRVCYPLVVFISFGLLTIGAQQPDLPVELHTNSVIVDFAVTPKV